MAKKKFDTNQLDPDFPARAAASSAATSTNPASPSSPMPPPSVTAEPELERSIASDVSAPDGETRMFDESVATRGLTESAIADDSATKKFDEASFNQYQAQFDGQSVPAPYQPPQPVFSTPDRTRKVAKIGLPENILTALPYVPFQLGLIVGVLELFFVPKSEAKVRFHAAQGVAAHLAILLISAILGGIGRVTDFAQLGATIFGVVTTIMLVVFAIKAYQGKPIHIEAVDDLTNWLEDKIKPSE